MKLWPTFALNLLLAILLIAGFSAFRSSAAETNRPPAGAALNADKALHSDVGTWYCTYYPKSWTNVIGYTNAVTYLPLCSDTPDDFRQYSSDDVNAIDFHLKKLAEARIDFIALELSPGGIGGYRKTDAFNYMVECGRKTCERIKRWNDTHERKIKYCIGAGVHEDCRGSDPTGLAIEKVSADVYATFYSNPRYGGPDNYYTLNGKPLLICYGLRRNQLQDEWSRYPGEKTDGNRFSLRTFTGYAQAGEYGWPLPLHQGTLLHSEVELIEPGFNVHRPNEVEPRNSGDFYRACWEKVLTNARPQIVMIQAFNDYLEESAVWTTDTRNLCANQEKWTRHDGKLDPSMYWDMTKQYIARLKDEKAVPPLRSIR